MKLTQAIRHGAPVVVGVLVGARCAATLDTHEGFAVGRLISHPRTVSPWARGIVGASRWIAAFAFQATENRCVSISLAVSLADSVFHTDSGNKKAPFPGLL